MIEVTDLSRIDCYPHGGVAGDMFSAAMSGAFTSLVSTVAQDVQNLAIDGLSFQVEKAMSAGLAGQRFVVSQPTNPKPPRTLAAVKTFFAGTSLNPQVADVATQIYTLLAEAEAAVHGKTLDTIHFHEVSDWDSMVDIVAASGFVSRLNSPLWRLAPLPLGGGTVHTAHGDIPVPAPATLALLDGFEWVDDGVNGERVTPTGAAILRYLRPTPMGAAVSADKLACTGQGCGTRELPGRANVFRVNCFTSSRPSDAVAPPAAGVEIHSDSMVRLAFEIDDMTGEELAHAQQRLGDHPQVVDFYSAPIVGKKGRAAHAIRILVEPEFADQVITQCFVWTSTLGVRHQSVARKVLTRSFYNEEEVRVKQALRPGGKLTAKAESDDLLNTDSLAQRRALAHKSEAIALASKDEAGDV